MDFFSKCDQIPRKLLILATFTKEILNGKLHFLFSERQFTTAFEERSSLSKMQ